jgi:hypothetical protein
MAVLGAVPIDAFFNYLLEHNTRISIINSTHSLRKGKREIKKAVPFSRQQTGSVVC